MGSHPHPVEDFTNGKYVAYQIKFEGIYSVGEASGPSPVQSAFLDMKKAKDERRKRGQKKAPIMEIQISTSGVKIMNLETNIPEVDVSLSKISFIMNDRNNKLYAAFIIKTNKGGYECVIVKDDTGRSKEIVMTLAEAFDLAFQKRVEDKNKIGNQNSENGEESNSSSTPPMEKIQVGKSLAAATVAPTLNEENSASVSQLKSENEIFKSRLEKLAELVEADLLTGFLFENQIDHVTDINTISEDGGQMSDSLSELYAELLKSRSQSKSSVVSRPDRSNTNPFVNMMETQSSQLNEETNMSVPPLPPRVTLPPPPGQKRTRAATTRPQSIISPLQETQTRTRPDRSVSFQPGNMPLSFPMMSPSMTENKSNVPNPSEDLMINISSDYKPKQRSNSNQEYEKLGLNIFDPINSSNNF